MNLNGTFAVSAVNGFLPNFGDAFVVLTFGSRVGDFATYTGLDLGTYRLLVPSFNPNNLTLTTVSSNHAPELDPIGDQAVDEGGTLAFTASASNFEAFETLTYSLDPGAPGAAPEVTGRRTAGGVVFRWSSPEAARPGDTWQWKRTDTGEQARTSDTSVTVRSPDRVCVQVRLVRDDRPSPWGNACVD